MVSFDGWNRKTVLLLVLALVVLVLLIVTPPVVKVLAVAVAGLAAFAQWLTVKTNRRTKQ